LSRLRMPKTTCPKLAQGLGGRRDDRALSLPWYRTTRLAPFKRRKNLLGSVTKVDDRGVHEPP